MKAATQAFEALVYLLTMHVEGLCYVLVYVWPTSSRHSLAPV